MEFNKVVVAGGGVLGSQIALLSAYSGHDTTIWLRSEGSIGRTRKKLDNYEPQIIASLEQSKKLIGNPMGAYVYPKGLIREWAGISEEKIDQLIAQAKDNFANKLHLELDMEKALSGADIVIESMSEDPAAKTAVYQKMAPLLDEDTILCTNSSTLLPSQFAEVTGRPEKYCAMHFANSIWKNNTAEIMGHPGTDPEVYKKVVAFAEDINMIPIQLKKEQPGYVLNTMLVPFLTAAEYLWVSGVADPETCDKTWELGTGAPAGPFKILDIVGLETAYNIVAMEKDAQEEGSVSYNIAKALKEKIDKGETGVNAGKGFYDYSK